AQDIAASLGGNPYRGMSIADLARACLEDAGVSVRGLNRHAIISNAITQSTSDFPNIFENALHKTLLAGFSIAPTTWDRVCKIGTLSDFRPHIRYRASSIGDLDVVQENGEYKTIALNDTERESIQAKSRGGIINVSREMLINDDMGVFSDLAMELGKSASRTREKALYVLLALNAGMGPLMGDGKALFHADHANISADPGAPSVSRIDKDRQQMASQKDPSGNDFVDIRPSIWLGPMALSGEVRIINNDQYDPDATNKLQRTNKARGTYSQVIDTPRLTGTPWFSLADPNAEPVLEMGFLDGEQTPQLATEEAFNQNGMKWRIADEWGLAAVGWRGALRNAGA
ncbi:MAG: Mu-like prophage major head subunit gpT family protein, partial [Solimonas sp.]